MIVLSETHLSAIREHGERDYPYEACGLLIGKFADGNLKIVHEAFPISNAREETAKRNRFLITPDELMRGERYAREKKLDVIGFYHSHPNALAIPSQYDLEHAWPTYSYIIVAVKSGRASDLFSYEQLEDRSKFEKEEIEVSDDRAARKAKPGGDRVSTTTR